MWLQILTLSILKLIEKSVTKRTTITADYLQIWIIIGNSRTGWAGVVLITSFKPVKLWPTSKGTGRALIISTNTDSYPVGSYICCSVVRCLLGNAVHTCHKEGATMKSNLRLS